MAKDAAAAGGKGASAKKPPPGLEINQLNKIKSKPELLLQLDDLPQEPGAGGDEATADGGRSPAVPAPRPCKRPKLLPTAVLSSFELHRMAAKSGDAAAAADAATAAAAPKLDKLSIASEYLDCVDQYVVVSLFLSVCPQLTLLLPSTGTRHPRPCPPSSSTYAVSPAPS